MSDTDRCALCRHVTHDPGPCEHRYGVPGFPSTQSRCSCQGQRPQTTDQGEAA